MNVGFIGLGAMGQHMARNLHRAGLLAGVWNRTAIQVRGARAGTGCTAFSSPAELAAALRLHRHLRLADDRPARSRRGALPGLRPGTLVDRLLDGRCGHGTDSRAASREPRRELLLDCPVSGGVEGAKNATLAIMCGGEPAIFERARPVLEALGKTIVLMGPTGAGQATKATNQILCAGVIEA